MVDLVIEVDSPLKSLPSDLKSLQNFLSMSQSTPRF